MLQLDLLAQQLLDGYVESRSEVIECLPAGIGFPQFDVRIAHPAHAYFLGKVLLTPATIVAEL
jgi:hypothetical protein